MRIVVPYGEMLHESQLAIAADTSRFKVIDCGRRWGKTRYATLPCVTKAAQGGVVWWVAPTYHDTSVGWRGLRRLAIQFPGVRIWKAEKRIEFPGGGWIEVRSADREDSLRSEGLDHLVFDEAPLAREDAWTEELRPALSDRKGSAVFIGTPKGKNWFYRLYVRGQSGHADWRSWQFPTSDSPFIDDAEIEAARSDLPELVFRQEYLAEFLEDAGGVFRRVMDAAIAPAVVDPTRKRQVVFGVDWGKSHDFTVIVAMDADTKAVVDFDRFNKIDYVFQSERLIAMYRKWRPFKILAEANAMGEPIIEQLVRAGLPVEGFMTMPSTKPQLIEDLSLGIEQGRVTFPPIDVLVLELQAFEYGRLPGGGLRYQAPSGVHDDCVIALALANRAAGGGSAYEFATTGGAKEHVTDKYDW